MSQSQLHVTQRFLARKVRRRQCPCPPPQKIFLAIACPKSFLRYFPLQFWSRERLIPKPMLLKTFRAAVILTFFSRIDEADEVSRGKGSEKISLVRQCLEVLGSSSCKPIGCARALWKWILWGYSIAPGNYLPIVWCDPRRQFPIIQMVWEANAGMPRLLTHSWQNFAVDRRRAQTQGVFYVYISARIWSFPSWG